MMPTDERYGGWPRSGEIDIMELLGHKPAEVHGTLHYGDDQKGHGQQGKSFSLSQGTFASEFHVFRLDWDPTQMIWYVDDQRFQVLTNWHTARPGFPAPFDQRFHLILNLAVGGNWPGAPDAQTRFPGAMEVDYVRVYRKL